MYTTLQLYISASYIISERCTPSPAITTEGGLISIKIQRSYNGKDILHNIILHEISFDNILIFFFFFFFLILFIDQYIFLIF